MRAPLRDLLELWFVVDWDEEGTYSAVRRKWVVDADPTEGDHVRVKCGKRIFGGCIVKQGR